MSAVHKLITDHLDIWTAADTEKKSGRGRASGNANSVYGIKKLRELILELAVRGKLVPQDPNDEPVENRKAFLKSKKQEMLHQRQVAYREISENPEIQAMKYKVPEGWIWMRFPDAVFFQEGPGIRNWQFTKEGIKLLNVSNILFTDELDFSNSDKFVAEEEFKQKYEHFELMDGDLLFAGSGASWGKVAWFKSPDFRVMLNTSTMRMRFFDSAFAPNFLFYFLKSPNFKSQLTNQLVGLQPNFGSTHLCRSYIALPPVEEQHRIVAKVDELMALCDQLEVQHNNAADAHEQLVSHLLSTLTQSQDAEDFNANWQRIATHFDTLFTTEASIDALKQTLLQLAVMGKLVPQDPNDEPASELLKRIQAEKEKLVAAGEIKKDKPQEVIGNNEKPFELPLGWNWTRMINCAKQITDGEHLTPERTTDTTKIPLVTAKNVRDGSMDYTTTDFVDFDVASKCWNRCKPELNDILIVSVGATIGRLTIISDHRDMVIVRSVTLVKPLLINIPYLAMTLRSPVLQQSIWAGVKQNAQPCLYLAVSNSLPIPVPPLGEQQRIVTKVGELMTLCEQLKSRIINTRRSQQKLADVLIEDTLEEMTIKRIV